MNPCLVRTHMGVHIAWNLEGKVIIATESQSEFDTVFRLGEFTSVPLNSAIANQIRDAMKKRLISAVPE